MSDGSSFLEPGERHRVVLPSRAFLLSWIHQTLPVRTAALEDAVAHFWSLDAKASDGQRDMAVLAVIAEAMQPLEDLAYLATAWEQPFGGLANYIRATVFSKRTAALFWQRIHKRDDDYFDVVAGYSARDGATGETEDLLVALESHRTGKGPTPEQEHALHEARLATRRRLRQLLGVLGADWEEFADYFYAYKHGGLTVHRPDVAWVEDDVDAVTEETPRRSPSLAAWLRGGKAFEGRGEFGLSAPELVRTAAGTGRLAIDLIDAFVHSRLTLFDAIELDEKGDVVALGPIRLPWTIWLREADLPTELWKLIGAGPWITWQGAAGLQTP
jgi:hypothetical protein